MTPALPCIVIGAGGHAGVLVDALLAGGHAVLGLTDADPARHGQQVCGRPVLGADDALAAYAQHDVMLVNGIGGVGDARSDALRHTVQQHLHDQGWRFTGVQHPAAVVSPFATLASGVQLLAASVVQAGAQVGEACIINTGAIVEHDCQVGAYSHIAPRALLCGGVRIGAQCHVGAGAVVRQGLSLAAGTVVGAGAVVIRSTHSACTLVGVPARSMELHA